MTIITLFPEAFRRRCSFLFFIVLMTVGAHASAQTMQKHVVTVNFGNSGILKYDLSSGRFNISEAGVPFIKQAYSSFKDKDKLISSEAYKHRDLTVATVKDVFGSGKKYTVTSTAPGLPVLKQIFYAYPRRPSLLMEIVVDGRELSSNYMAPLITANAIAGPDGDNRTLFVPFDNDNFVSYDAKSLHDSVTNLSAEVGAAYEEKSKSGIVTGSIEHGVWKTGVKTTGQANKLSDLEVWGGFSDEKITRDEVVHGSIHGNSLKSPKIMIGYFRDWRLGMDEYGTLNKLADPSVVTDRSDVTPLGWNSWGALQDKLSFDKAYKVVDFFADSLKAFRSGNTVYIDLDAYWNNLIPDGIKGDFAPLKAFADYCHSKGLQAGAYMGPFTDWGWHGGPDRKVEGTDYTYGELWTKVNGKYHDFDGGRAIDPTHPGTKKNIEYILNKLKASGFTMMKIDFLGHGAIEADSYYDKKVTTGMQAYREGMEFLTKALGDKMLIYAAISPSLATGRYVHMRRIACDAFKSIDNTRYTLNSINYGWWQSNLYSYIDADHIVFGNETAGTNRARLTSGLIAGSLILGDDYSINGPWKARIKQWMSDESLLKIARERQAFEPVETNTGDKSGHLFFSRIGNVYYLAAFNFGKNPLAEEFDLSAIGLKADRQYQVTELFSKSNERVQGNLHISMGPEDAAIYTFTLAK